MRDVPRALAGEPGLNRDTSDRRISVRRVAIRKTGAGGFPWPPASHARSPSTRVRCPRGQLLHMPRGPCGRTLAHQVGLAADVVAAVAVGARGRDAPAALDERLAVNAVPEQVDDVADFNLAALDDFFVTVAPAGQVSRGAWWVRDPGVRRRLDVVAARGNPHRRPPRGCRPTAGGAARVVGGDGFLVAGSALRGASASRRGETQQRRQASA